MNAIKETRGGSYEYLYYHHLNNQLSKAARRCIKSKNLHMMTTSASVVALCMANHLSLPVKMQRPIPNATLWLFKVGSSSYLYNYPWLIFTFLYCRAEVRQGKCSFFQEVIRCQVVKLPHDSLKPKIKLKIIRYNWKPTACATRLKFHTASSAGINLVCYKTWFRFPEFPLRDQWSIYPSRSKWLSSFR